MRKEEGCNLPADTQPAEHDFIENAIPFTAPGQQAAAGFTINVNGGISNTVSELPGEVGNINVAPNPVRDYALVSFESLSGQVANLDVFDLSGKVVYSQQLAVISGLNQLTVPTAAFETGAYVLRLIANGTNTTQRFAKVLK